MKKIVFFGDSNTYGYDPRGFLDDRYPEEFIWTSIVAAAFPGCLEVVNRGRNGRMIPAGSWDYRYVEQLLSGMKETDIFAVMLGSNDIFMTMNPHAEEPVTRMDRFLSWLTGLSAHPDILVIAPPYPDPEESGDPAFGRFAAESAVMNAGFRRLAAGYGTDFLDASAWGVEAAFDGVHFSEAGHKTFARNIIRWLEHRL